MIYYFLIPDFFVHFVVFKVEIDTTRFTFNNIFGTLTDWRQSRTFNYVK